MGKYRIKIDYSTGDSFSNSYESDLIDLEWDDIEVAKKNLGRIKEHYEMYQRLNSYFNNISQFDIVNEYKNKDWFVSGENKLLNIKNNCIITKEEADRIGVDNFKVVIDVDMASRCIIFITDNKTPMQIGCFWCGCFEHLDGAEIIIDQDDDIKFIVN